MKLKEKARKSQKNIRTEKGITLIALVITIIVLILLAMITIAMLTGPNGLLNKSLEAKIANDKAEIQDRVETEVLASIGDNGKINWGELEGNLKNNVGIEETITEKKEGEEIKVLTFTVGKNNRNYEVNIDEKGKVTVEEEGTGGTTIPSKEPSVEPSKEPSIEPSIAAKRTCKYPGCPKPEETSEHYHCDTCGLYFPYSLADYGEGNFHCGQPATIKVRIDSSDSSYVECNYCKKLETCKKYYVEEDCSSCEGTIFYVPGYTAGDTGFYFCNEICANNFLSLIPDNDKCLATLWNSAGTKKHCGTLKNYYN